MVAGLLAKLRAMHNAQPTSVKHSTLDFAARSLSIRLLFSVPTPILSNTRSCLARWQVSGAYWFRYPERFSQAARLQQEPRSRQVTQWSGARRSNAVRALSVFGCIRHLTE